MTWPGGLLHPLRKGDDPGTNLTAAALLGLGLDRSELLRQPLTGYILPDDQDIYYLHRKQILRQVNRSRAI